MAANPTVTSEKLRPAFRLSLLQKLTPQLMAAFFGLWALRNVNGNSIADFDAPRHALNGAFILDMVRHAKFLHPVQYGYWYYSRLPAISLPYHPPLFPTFEALVYAVFGVTAFSARLSVAIVTSIAVSLLFRLVRASHGSYLLAGLVTTSFFILPLVQTLSSMVMLELPALVLVLASLRFLLPNDGTFDSRRFMYFAVFAAAAIWTKQCVFLFLLPPVYVVICRRWRLLRNPFIWISWSSVGLSGAAMALLDRELQWNGVNQSWAKKTALQHIAHNLWFYMQHRGFLGLLLIVFCLLTYRLPGGSQDWRKEEFYISWIASVMVMLLASPAYSGRYLFFAIPPFLVLLYDALFRLGRLFCPLRAFIIPVAVCFCVVIYGLIQVQGVYLRGPNEAASYLHGLGRKRVLFCGATSNGSFIFAVRSHDPGLNTIVIRGDKLPADTFTPERLNQFIQRYGIDSVVLERTGLPQPWDSLSAPILGFLGLERVLPMTDAEALRNGSLSIYRVLHPSMIPQTSLQVPISVLGRDVELHF